MLSGGYPPPVTSGRDFGGGNMRHPIRPPSPAQPGGPLLAPQAPKIEDFGFQKALRRADTTKIASGAQPLRQHSDPYPPPATSGPVWGGGNIDVGIHPYPPTSVWWVGWTSTGQRTFGICVFKPSLGILLRKWNPKTWVDGTTICMTQNMDLWNDHLHDSEHETPKLRVGGTTIYMTQNMKLQNSGWVERPSTWLRTWNSKTPGGWNDHLHDSEHGSPKLRMGGTHGSPWNDHLHDSKHET